MYSIDMRGCRLDAPNLEARLVRTPKVEMHFHFEGTFRARARSEKRRRGQEAARRRLLVSAGEAVCRFPGLLASLP